MRHEMKKNLNKYSVYIASKPESTRKRHTQSGNVNKSINGETYLIITKQSIR